MGKAFKVDTIKKKKSYWFEKNAEKTIIIVTPLNWVNYYNRRERKMTNIWTTRSPIGSLQKRQENIRNDGITRGVRECATENARSDNASPHLVVGQPVEAWWIITLFYFFTTATNFIAFFFVRLRMLLKTRNGNHSNRSKVKLKIHLMLNLCFALDGVETKMFKMTRNLKLDEKWFTTRYTCEQNKSIIKLRRLIE